MADSGKTLEDTLAALERAVEAAEKRLESRKKAARKKDTETSVDPKGTLDERARRRLQKEVERVIQRIEALLKSLNG